MGKQRIIKTTVLSQIATKVKWAISLEEVGMRSAPTIKRDRGKDWK